MAFDSSSNDHEVEIEGDVIDEGQHINVKTVGKPASQR